jgi:hypothetical protein
VFRTDAGPAWSSSASAPLACIGKYSAAAGSEADQAQYTSTITSTAISRRRQIAVILVVGHVYGRQVARFRDVATHIGGSATHRHSLPEHIQAGAPVLLSRTQS